MNPIDDYILTALCKLQMKQDDISQSFHPRAQIEITLRRVIEKAMKQYQGEQHYEYDSVANTLFGTLVSYGAIADTTDPIAGTYYRIIYDKFSNWRRSFLAENEIAIRATLIGTRFLRDVFKVFFDNAEQPTTDAAESDDVSFGDLIPASDRLVTIDHNSPDYEALVRQAEEASEAIRGSNSIDEDSRGWIRIHIAAGVAFLKNRKVLAGVASALLLEPLLKAYEAVTEEPAKQAILAAVQAVRSFFGFI